MKTKVSIVVALLNEEEGLENTCKAIVSKVDSIPELELELILVDDGSTDSSWQIIKKLSKDDPRIRGLKLSRNFGNHTALLAGLKSATGDVAMNLAADLQAPTDLLPRFLAEYKKGAEVVLAARQKRDDHWTDLFFARIFYGVATLFTDLKIPRGGIDTFFISKKVKEELTRTQGRNASILGLIMNLGFSYVLLFYDRKNRQHGKSKWTLIKKINLFADGIFPFSGKPLRSCLILGLITLFFSVLSGGLSLYLTGWSLTPTLLLSAVLLTISGQLFSVALLGEYLFRVFQEVSKRPLFVISEETPDSK